VLGRGRPLRTWPSRFADMLPDCRSRGTSAPNSTPSPNGGRCWTRWTPCRRASRSSPRCGTGWPEAVADATARLDADRAWSALDDADRAAILSDVGLLAPAPLAVDTDQALRRELEKHHLSAWHAETDAVPSREAGHWKRRSTATKKAPPPSP